MVAASLFSGLSQPPSPGSYAARVVPDHPTYRIARSHQGWPCLLVEVQNHLDGVNPVDIVGEYVEVRHGRQCTVIDPEGVLYEGRFTIALCRSGDESLQGFFLEVKETIVRLLGDTPDSAGVASAMRHLLELFRTLATPARRSVQGLWGELLLIASASDPALSAGAWHSHPENVYDFSRSSQRVEVKSSSRRSRQHAFTHRQMWGPEGVDVIVASIFVESSGEGTTIRHLLQEVRDRLASHPERIARVERIVAETLGQDLSAALDEPFDREIALDSLAFHDVKDMPRIDRDDVPSGVSDVRMVSDLTECPELSEERIQQDGGLTAALTPDIDSGPPLA